MRVNDMWFIEPGGEPLTFREVFLKSRALENIIAGEQSILTAHWFTLMQALQCLQPSHLI